MKILFSSFIIFCLIISSCTRRTAGEFNVKALPVDAGITGNLLSGPSVLSDPDRFVWGASVVEGYDGKFHMLYSTWESGEAYPPFSDSWVTYSKIAYAVSNSPDRDFEFQGIVLEKRTDDSTAWDALVAHNPHIKKFNTKYYLYYVGSTDPGLQPKGSKGEHLNLRNRVQQNQKIGVIEFNDFNDLLQGNFTRPNQPLLAPRTRVKQENVVAPSPEGTIAKPDNLIVVNPSVVFRPDDGKYLLYFKGNIYEPHWKGVHGVATSDSPTGPFTALDNFVFDIRNGDGTIASGEDPYVWYHQKNKKFYCVLKDFSGAITSGQPGLAILTSKDGIKWEKPQNSFFMKKQIILQNGDTLEVDRLERPQLLIDNQGKPKVLYCATSIGPANSKTDGSTFNVHIPLKAE